MVLKKWADGVIDQQWAQLIERGEKSEEMVISQGFPGILSP